MVFRPANNLLREPSLEAYLLGTVDFSSAVLLQERIALETAACGDGQITLLLCEHPPCISIGRKGSRGDILLDEQHRREDVPIHWVSRGGPALAHGPGQIAVYPMVSLRWHGWSVGEYLDRFRSGIQSALSELRLRTTTHPREDGLWGKSGKLVSFGISVRHDVTLHGAFINLAPSAQVFHRVLSDLSDSQDPRRMSAIAAERRDNPRATSLREALVRHLTNRFDCLRYHLYSTHPLLRRPNQVPRESSGKTP